MIPSICLGRMLRETTSTPYRTLVTRPTGAQVRARIESALGPGGAEAAVLDFTQVSMLDLSCADEIVAKLLLGASAVRLVVLRGLDEHSRETVEHVLGHHGLASALLDGELPDLLIGRADSDLRAEFRRLAGPAVA